MAHTIKALLSAYDSAYRRKFGVPAPIVGAKDAALAKRLLARYSSDQLAGWVERFFELPDPFIMQSGYTFGVFASCLGKVIAADKPTPQVSARTLRNMKGIYGE